MSGKKADISEVSSPLAHETAGAGGVLPPGLEDRGTKIKEIRDQVVAGTYQAHSNLIAQSMWSHLKTWFQRR